MNHEEIKASIEGFFDAIEGEVPAEERISQLSFALDRIALAVHFSDHTFDERDFLDAEGREYVAVRAIVSRNFELGYYNVVLDISDRVAETSLAVGDAIDDICDIAGDLENVLWRWDNTSIDDALWHFRESYVGHWGMHLRNLQLYLHDIQT